ncbi:MAG TPA: endolytic transglycosylase MltG [Amoebophilaceae bacterium]|nr:endolytic transglycosylase MltG [Amoebophilaceae bacterium]
MNTRSLAKAVLFVVGGMVCFLGYCVLGKPNVLVQQKDRLFLVPRGEGLFQVAQRLKQERYISNVTTFVWTAWLLRYRPEATPGCYRLHSNESNWKTIRLLRGAMQTPLKINFSAAENKTDLAAQLTQNTGVSKQAFEALLNDTSTVGSYGFTPENVLTLFIPDTYEVYWTISAKQLFLKMHAAYQHFWNAKRLKQASEMGLTPIQVSILASIVQSETNHLSEAAVIAGVYVNRLQRNMRLQSCPTLLYTLRTKQPKRNRVLWEDLKLDSPYNLYRQKGLPPGPITLPSVAMIDAVLNYVKHDYLFFSAREDFSGMHYFSRTHTEHVKQASKYRAALTKRNIMQ